jgi:hypothetical protein
MRHDAPLEDQHQEERQRQVEPVIGVPLLPVVDAQQVVADVPVHPVDVRVGVVDVVVAALPVLCWGDDVPLVGLAVDRRVIHPVVLAVHDVVADLHVLENLGETEQHDAGDEGRQEERHEDADAPEHLERSMHLDDAADVVGVLLAEVVEHALAKAVQLAAEPLQVVSGHVLQADVRLVVRVVRRERLRRGIVVAGAERFDRSVRALV